MAPLITILPALSFASTMVGAVGQVAAGNQAARASEYNAQLSRQHAVLEQQVAGAKEYQARREFDELAGTQHAAVGASGTTGAGSPSVVMQSSAADAEMDALMIRYGGQLEAYKALSQASMDEWEAKQHRAQGWLGATGTLLNYGVGELGSRVKKRTMLSED